MKKIIFALLFTLIGFAAFAQSTFSIEGGFIPRSSAVAWETPSPALELDTNVFYIDLSTRLFAFDYFFAGGSVTTWMVAQGNDYTAFPFYTSYLFNLGFQKDGLEIGFEHRCSHSISTLGYVQEPLYKLDSASDKLYVKMSWEF